MTIFTIESSHHLPIYRHTTLEADTIEEACQRAIENDDWSTGKSDHDSAGETYVSGVWVGHDAYQGEPLPVPSQFDERVLRRSVHFHEMLCLLTDATQLMHADDPDITLWRSKARAAIEKAEAILSDAPDPE
jgi:hypothetical protein